MTVWYSNKRCEENNIRFPISWKKNLTVWYSNGQCDQNNIRFTSSCKANLTVWHSNEQCDHKHNRFLLGNFWRHINFKRCKHNSLECIRFQNKIRKCLNRSCLLSLSIFLNNSRVLRLSVVACPAKANSSTLIYPSLSRSQASNLHGSNKVTAFAGKLRLYKYIQNRYKLKIAMLRVRYLISQLVWMEKLNTHRVIGKSFHRGQCLMRKNRIYVIRNVLLNQWTFQLFFNKNEKQNIPHRQDSSKYLIVKSKKQKNIWCL